MDNYNYNITLIHVLTAILIELVLKVNNVNNKSSNFSISQI